MTTTLDEVMELTKPLEDEMTDEQAILAQTCGRCNGRKRDHEGEDHLFVSKAEPVQLSDLFPNRNITVIYPTLITTSGTVREVLTLEQLAEQVDATPGLAEKIDDIVASTKPKFELSEEQQEAKSLIKAWLKERNQEFRLGGYAGTGKTTLIKDILADLRGTISIGVAAFTGKAVAVLRKKGVHRAQTLHALLYHSEYDSRQKKIIWIPKTVLPYDMVIVDEASMVSTSLYDDLRRHNIKILFVGDPAQLEPVGDNPNLMRECDYTLRNIHRQARKSPILRLARAVREGMTDIPLGEWGDDEVGHLRVVDTIYGIDLADYDVVVCAKNATRHAINARRRAQLDRHDEPVEGESTICLANNRNFGVFNGMMLTIQQINEHRMYGDKPGFEAILVDDAGDEYLEVPIFKEYFGKDFKRDITQRHARAIPFDYGYCLTAHKSQGSEWDRVLVLDEPLWKIDPVRWKYTAFTRAAKELTIVRTG